MKIIVIVAMTPERVIGRAGAIPWRDPEDLRHFKRTTLGHAVVMGRKTYESLGRPLPGRRNVVITRNREYRVGDVGDETHVRAENAGEQSETRVDIVHSLEAALGLCRRRGEEKAFVIGGAEIYALALPIADEMIVTHIDRDDLAGDAYFPAFRTEDWTAEPGSSERDLRIVRYRRASEYSGAANHAGAGAVE